MTELVLISCFNYGCIELALNFLESLKKLGIHHKHISFVTDEESYNKLKELGYNTELVSDTNTVKDKMMFDSDDFKNLSYLRYKIMYDMLKKHKYVWYFDVDTVVLGDVTTLIDKLPPTFDIAFQMDMDSHCTGCMLVQSNPLARNFIKFIYYNRNTQVNDQIHMMRTLRFMNNVSSKLEYYGLDMFSFVNGDIYFNGKFEEEFKKSTVPVYFVHANYMVGIDVKIQALKDKGLWFLKNI